MSIKIYIFYCTIHKLSLLCKILSYFFAFKKALKKMPSFGLIYFFLHKSYSHLFFYSDTNISFILFFLCVYFFNIKSKIIKYIQTFCVHERNYLSSKIECRFYLSKLDQKQIYSIFLFISTIFN